MLGPKQFNFVSPRNTSKSPTELVSRKQMFTRMGTQENKELQIAKMTTEQKKLADIDESLEEPDKGSLDDSTFMEPPLNQEMEITE